MCVCVCVCACVCVRVCVRVFDTFFLSRFLLLTALNGAAFQPVAMAGSSQFVTIR